MTDTLEQTRCWVKEVVIGLNLCPFARVPFTEGSIRYQVCEATEEDAIYKMLIQEVAEFVRLPAEQAETGLFILAQGLADFDSYLNMLEDIQFALQEAGLENMLQLASFHPDYCFAGMQENDPANYTNRSPFPMFHLIRQDGLAAALENWPEPEMIPQRNVALLREMGQERIHELLEQCKSPLG